MTPRIQRVDPCTLHLHALNILLDFGANLKTLVADSWNSTLELRCPRRMEAKIALRKPKEQDSVIGILKTLGCYNAR